MQTVLFSTEKIVPSKIVCVGWNYVEHIRELGSIQTTEPTIFCKPNSSISDVLLSDNSSGLHYEGEISFIILHKKIAGVGMGFDLTRRDVQKKLKESGQPWERSKAFDGSAVFSPFVPVDLPLNHIHFELLINDSLVQKGNYEMMIFKPEVIFCEIQKFMTLEDGDIIMTGTPQGVGPFKVGDRFLGKIFNGSDLLIQKEWIVRRSQNTCL